MILSLLAARDEARPGWSLASSGWPFQRGWPSTVRSRSLPALGKEEKGRPNLGLHGPDLGLHGLDWASGAGTLPLPDLPGVGDGVVVGLSATSGGWLPPCTGWSWRGTEVPCHVGVGVLRLGDYNCKASRRRRCEATWIFWPQLWVWEMSDDTDESPARLGWRRWRPRVSFSFLEASSRCLGIFLVCLDLVVVFGRKP
jgi:hypothetical protein